MASTSTLLALPRELRDHIIGELFFPNEKATSDLVQDHLGLAHTAPRQIFPFHPDAPRRPKFDVTILRACRQLQLEGEAILYGSSSFSFMYDDWSHHIPKLSYQFLEQFPKRLRRLIQRVERKCYSGSYYESISLFEWDAFMRFLAEECPSLHTLRLWGPGDRAEGIFWVAQCTTNREWVQSILRIKTLQTFDIPVIQGGNIYSFPEFRDLFLPWLKKTLTAKKSSLEVQSSSVKAATPFRLLDLPLEIQRMIYRRIALSDDRRIYVDMKSWFNKNTQDGLSLMKTCKSLYNEVGMILFEESIFYGDTPDLAFKPSGGINRGRLLARIGRRPVDEISRIGRIAATSKFNIRHLNFVLDDGLIEIDLVGTQSRIWDMQLESLTLRINRMLSSQLRSIFNHIKGDIDTRQLDPELFASPTKPPLLDSSLIPRHEWSLGHFNLEQMPSYTELLRLIARIPNVQFCYAEATAPEITEDYAKWLTKGLRREWLVGSPSIPGIEWLFVDPRSDLAWSKSSRRIILPRV